MRPFKRASSNSGERRGSRFMPQQLSSSGKENVGTSGVTLDSKYNAMPALPRDPSFNEGLFAAAWALFLGLLLLAVMVTGK